MATNAPVVELGRVRLTEKHLRALEIALYKVADMRDRLLADGEPYTKINEEELHRG